MLTDLLNNLETILPGSQLGQLRQEMSILREYLNKEIKRRELLEEKVTNLEKQYKGQPKGNGFSSHGKIDSQYSVSHLFHVRTCSLNGGCLKYEY